MDLYRLSIEQYHRMGAAGILTPPDQVELLEGWVVQKPPQNPAYRQRQDFGRDNAIPLVLGGQTFGPLPVRDLLPARP
jgi:hypothetical protein